MTFYDKAARFDELAARMVLAVVVAAVVSGCAKEPPEDERMSVKDSWANGTTVTHAASPPPAKVVYSPPPQQPPKASPPPRADRIVKPRVLASPPSPPPTSQPAPPKVVSPKASSPRGAPPDLALSSPTVEPVKPQPAQPLPTKPVPAKPLSEADLANGMQCGPGLDCLALLRAMIADPQQSWMARTPTLADFTNGTRLFAYRALRETLDCGKLRFANAELDWAVDTFSGTVVGVELGHRARVVALAEAVRKEIDGEIKKRC